MFWIHIRLHKPGEISAGKRKRGNCVHKGLFVSFNIKEPYLEIVIQGKKFNTLAVFRHI